MFEAYLHDKDVIDEMAKAKNRPKPAPPRLRGWTAELAALRDICDQLIASRGGTKFVPRPKVPGLEERWRRKDSALHNTIARVTGTD